MKHWLMLAVVMAAGVLSGSACKRPKDAGSTSESVAGCLETNPRQGIAADCMACLKAHAIESPVKDGCCGIQDSVGRQLCDKAAACMRAGGPPVGPCNIGGDTTTCFCGTHQVNCWDPGVPNGPCIEVIKAAAGRNIETLATDSPNEDQILKRYGDVKYALGRASNVASIAGAFCSGECEIVKTK